MAVMMSSTSPTTSYTTSCRRSHSRDTAPRGEWGEASTTGRPGPSFFMKSRRCFSPTHFSVNSVVRSGDFGRIERSEDGIELALLVHLLKSAPIGDPPGEILLVPAERGCAVHEQRCAIGAHAHLQLGEVLFVAYGLQLPLKAQHLAD